MLIRAVAIVTDRNNFREFRVLAEEAGYRIVDTVYVRRLTPRGLSEAKLEEVREAVRRSLAEVVLFDKELKPKHMYNLWKHVNVQVRDRVEVILEIFRRHSPSKEADLQIKLASLNYELARAREKVLLAKSGEQPALIMGPGQYEVDKYYLEIKRRIQTIKRKLEEERRKRSVHRGMRRRRGYKTIAITGYTCSGKTTLFNYLSGMSMKTGDEPFTTLSTKYSLLKIGLWKAYIIDTIGFIQDLPPFVISAFYSTLEEVSEADIVYLVVDVSEELDKASAKLETSLDILDKLGFKGKVIIVGNKVDQINNREALRPVKSLFDATGHPSIFISAATGEGVDKLLRLTEELLGIGVETRVEIPYTRGDFFEIVGMVKEEGVGGFEELEDRMVFRGRLLEHVIDKLIHKGVKVYAEGLRSTSGA